MSLSVGLHWDNDDLILLGSNRNKMKIEDNEIKSRCDDYKNKKALLFLVKYWTWPLQASMASFILPFNYAFTSWLPHVLCVRLKYWLCMSLENNMTCLLNAIHTLKSNLWLGAQHFWWVMFDRNDVFSILSYNIIYYWKRIFIVVFAPVIYT